MLKAFTESSSFFIRLLYTRFINQKNIFLSELPDSLVNLTATPNTTPTYNRSIFNFQVNRQNHIYPPELPKSSFSRWTKFGFGMLGVGIGFWEGYNYHRTADAAIVQANAAIEANRLQRLALAKQYPELAASIYKNHPEEYSEFKAYKK